MDTKHSRILIVDDNPDVRSMLRRLLLHAGYANLICTDNADYAAERIHERQVDLVLLDWEMPQFSGYELLRMVRPERPELPIIMVTSINQREKIMRAVKAGCSDYITKPWKADQVLQKIEKYLREKHSPMA